MKMKTQEEIRNFFLDRDYVDLSRNAKELEACSDKLNQNDLEGVEGIFQHWKKFLSPSAYSQFVIQLLVDLVELGCCAVSGAPASPCYIGKLAHSVPVEVPNVNMYTAHNLRALKLKRSLSGSSAIPY